MEARVKVSAVAAQAMAKAAQVHGISSEALCRTCGLERLPGDALAMMPSTDADALCATAEALTGVPVLGLEAAQLVVDDAWPLVDRLAAASPTLESAFQAIADSFGLIDPRCRFEVSRSRGEVRVQFSVGPDRRPPPPLAEDFTWATLVLRLRRAVGVRFSPARLRLARPRPSDLRPWTKLFGVTPTFSSSSELRLSSRTAALPTREPSPLLLRALQPLVGRRPRASTTLFARTERALDELIETGRPTLVGLASAVGVTRRTLQRRLQAMGTSYAALVTERRVARARELLLEDLPVAAVSRAVGFSDQTSLTRAFRRIHGFGPSAWRRAQTDRSRRSSR
jgi:AraC-like DNA-binding protein